MTEKYIIQYGDNSNYMKTKTNTKFYWTKKRIAEAQKIEKKNYWAKWKLILAVTLGGVTAIIFPFALDTMKPTDHFPQARVVRQEVKAVDHIPQTVKMVETVEQTIRRLAKEANFKWENYLVKLLYCESRLDPLAVNDKNNNPKHSKDRGIAQINNHWHSKITDEQAFNLEWSVKWTMEQINNGRQSMWVCDRIVRNKG